MDVTVALIGQLTGLIVALTGLIGVVGATIKLLRRERPKTVRSTAEVLIEASEDGVITVDELKRIVEAGDR